MKKTKYITLVLVTSLLAACKSTRYNYAAMYQNYKAPNYDSIPTISDNTQPADTTIYYPDTAAYYSTTFFNFELPYNYNTGPNYIYGSPHYIERGGFGQYGTHISLAS